eukprot:TRINITY_DN20604_c0_g4_i1.p1 TRINITY_DN20604_c0_g4~~TRINITY_DN20604_c0_g4_i1.p1  ORF type:complete len:212 (-),score=29.39 TRINITY_DN20604_c0_g4_i1:197-832(-)
MRRRRLLTSSARFAALVALLTVNTNEAAEKSGLCGVGRCINCISCAGDCRSERRCDCFDEANTCCCSCPVGHYARGWGQIACPGGTYQDEMGAWSCKPCNATAVQGGLFNVSIRGAIYLEDCAQAACGCIPGPGGDACRLSECRTPSEIEAEMTKRPRSKDFCTSLGIKYGSCNWREESNLARARLGAPATALGNALLVSAALWSLAASPA